MKERALVECILHLDWVDEGLLIEALKDYMERHWNEKELYEVTDFLKLADPFVDQMEEAVKNARKNREWRHEVMIENDPDCHEFVNEKKDIDWD